MTAEAEPLIQPAPPRIAAPSRLVSLDAYRGFIMLLLVSHGFGFAVFKSYPNLAWLAGQVDHAAWEGCTFWDLIQPAFTFMVGMAMPLAAAKRAAEGASAAGILKHVLWRALMLIVLSNVLSNFNGNKPPTFQLINVLCQIAIGYVLCHLILQLPFRAQIGAAAAMLALHWGLFVMFPGPDGPFSKTGNIGGVLDLKLLGYNYSGYYTTLNALGNAVTILFGCWAGLLMRSDRDHGQRLRILGACAAAALAIGLALQPFNPMVKRLWTTSFCFFSAGWVILMLMAFYWIVDVKGYKRWTFPLIVTGMNSIFIYSFSQVLSGWLRKGIGNLTWNFGFLGDLGAIPVNLLTMAAMWYMCYWLHRRRIYFKL